VKIAVLLAAVVSVSSAHAQGTKVLQAWNTWSPTWATVLLHVSQDIGGFLACAESGRTAMTWPTMGLAMNQIQAFSLIVRQDGQHYIAFRAAVNGDSLGNLIHIAVDHLRVGTYRVSSTDPAQNVVRATLSQAEFKRLFLLFRAGRDVEIAVDRLSGIQSTLTLSLEGFGENIADFIACEHELSIPKLPPPR
jgi:hypothetical protein